MYSYSRKIIEDRIFAMFALGAIGDALGAPIEIMTKSAIAEKYGRLTSFVERTDHKFGPIKKGETTDDTQLKLAIARSIAHCGAINLDDIAREHVIEYDKITRGWGGTTKDAVALLKDGVHWSRSGHRAESSKDKRGKGNGVAMKIDPLGAYYVLQEIDREIIALNRDMSQALSKMTHATGMGVAQGYAHETAIYILLKNPDLDVDSFVSNLSVAAEFGENEYATTLDTEYLSERFWSLLTVKPDTSDEELAEKFGDGGCYVYDSLPLAYALFLRKPDSIEALYDAVNFGGDTDTVGSIVGSLLGANNGSALIPQELWAQVDRKEEIERTVEEFIRAVTPK